MKKHFSSIAFILFFIGILVFDYIRHGIPAVFFSDLGNVIYPTFANLGEKNLLLTYLRGWNDMLSFPFYWANANLNFVGPLFFFFVKDIWLRVKLVQVLQIILAAMFAYLLSWRIATNKKIAIISALLYATTPLFFSMLNGHNSLAWSYVLLPLLIFFIEKTVVDKKMYLALFTGILFSLATFISALQFVYYIGIPVFFYLVIRAGIQLVWEVKTNFRLAQIKYVLLAGVVSLTFAGFFLVPTFFESQPYTRLDKESTERKSDFVTNFYTPTVKDAIRLQSKEQMVSAEFGYTLDAMPNRFTRFYFFISLLALTSMGIALAKKIKLSAPFHYWPFFLAGAVSFILSFGKYTFFYRLLNNYLPYFWTIRTPSRFLIFYALLVSIFASLAMWKFLDWLFSEIKKQSAILIIKSSALVFIAALILYNAIFFGQTLWTFKTLKTMDEHYPDVSAVQKELSKLDSRNEYRVLDLVVEKDGNPHHLKAYSSGHRTLANTHDVLWRFKDDKNLARILGLLNVKYVLTAPWPHWPEARVTPFPSLEKRLSIDPSFRVAYSAPSGIKIWENQSALPRTFAAAPILVAGPPSALSKLLDIIPKESNPAIFFADQIQDQVQIKNIINKSSLVFVDYSMEEKPSYLDQVNFGLAFNNNFYLNPQEYRNGYQQIIELAKAKNKPIIQYKEQGSVFGINLLSNSLAGPQDFKIERVKNTASIVLQQESRFRAEPARFNEPSETVYKIASSYTGKLKINIDAISLFNNNYVQVLSSFDNTSYTDVLNLKGDNEYPEFYYGNIWIPMDLGKPLFLKLRLFADEKNSRQTYDSRIEDLTIDFIKDSSYNYNGITSEELSKIIPVQEELVLQKNQPGRLTYEFSTLPLEPSTVVATEIYTSDWALSHKNQKIKSLPVNIFENGFLAVSQSDDKFTIAYSMSIARWIGLFFTLGTVAVTLIAFKKRL